MKNGRTTLRTFRWLCLGSTAAIVAALAACSDTNSPATSPAVSRAADDAVSRAIAKAQEVAAPIPDATVAQSLLRTTPLANEIVVTKVIPQNGGVIDVPGADFRLEVPKGAFRGPSMTFTVHAIAGSAVAYDFEPHGSEFLVPLRYVQRLGSTNWGHLPPMPPGFNPDVNGAYFPAAGMVDPATGIAVVTEMFQITYSPGEISFPIRHFSGYLISTGRGYGGDR
ncbi:MAG TPA: hypothetical protein VGM82_12905 [Gemmatimonadaceae bacterium]|jgi:hypothetical protein